MGLATFEWTGGPLLLVYVMLFAAAALASYGAGRMLRPAGRYGSVCDTEQLAYLAGGSARYAEAAITRLYTQGRFTLDPKRGIVETGRPADSDSAGEQEVLRLTTPATFTAVHRALQPHARQVRDRLIGKGLLLGAGEARVVGLMQALPFMILLAIGAITWTAASAGDHRDGFLVAMVAAALVLSVIRYFGVDRRTRSGMAAFQDARLSHQRLQRAAPTDEAALAVALFGTSVLAGSQWSDLHDFRHANSAGGDVESSDSDGDGGGGGCGGGCGG